MSISQATFSSSYKSRYLVALIAVSSIPAAVSLMNFGVFSNTLYQLTLVFSLLSILSGAHVWINLAYYVDPQWRSYFNCNPVVFYFVPLAIFGGTLGLIAQPNKAIGLSVLYGATFLNLWHHSKQNWGILAIIGKIRGKNVTALRYPLIYAWPFFIIPWALQLPELKAFFGEQGLYWISIACIVVYAFYCLATAYQHRFSEGQDPVVIAAGIALCCYFLPLVLLYGKPYALFIWAAAHGLQYYLMIFTSLSLRNRESVDLRGIIWSSSLTLAMLVGLTVISYTASQSVSVSDLWSDLTLRVIMGTILGVNLIHFWVDTFIWKFSEKGIRNLHGQAFNF
jgi:hypothetical protein